MIGFIIYYNIGLIPALMIWYMIITNDYPPLKLHHKLIYLGLALIVALFWPIILMCYCILGDII